MIQFRYKITMFIVKGNCMKRILAGLFILASFAIGCSAQAREYVYNSAGGLINTRPVEFGSNALFTPQNAIRAGERHRYIKHQNQLYNGIEKGNTININLNTSNNGENSSNIAIPKKRSFVKNKFLKDTVIEKK